MNRKLPAFTLMELLVGMIISSIVIGFGYGTYALVYKQYLSYKTVKKEIVEAMQLNSILNSDFAAAENILFNENKLTIDKKDNIYLQYDFNDSIVLRKENEITDTFKIVPVAITASFIFPEQKAVVSTFSFQAKLLDETEGFVFTKNYSAETLMNYEMKLKK